MADPTASVTVYSPDTGEPVVIAPATTNTETSTSSSVSVAGSLSPGETIVTDTASLNSPTTSVTGTSAQQASSTASGTSNPTSNASGNSFGGIKIPAATNVISNPMHQYASWSYAWSLWWLDVGDFNALQATADVGPALTLPLSKSYVIAEDSGLYPNQRLPTQVGLNYNIEDVQFESLVGLNGSTKSTNMSQGTLTVVEPYGVTFIDSLVAASFNGTTHQNYLQQPYMLQLDFFGYDSNGNQLPANQTALYRKRFPILLSKVKVNVTNQGAKYMIEFKAKTSQAHMPEHSKVPKNMTVTAATVADFFDPAQSTSFTAQMNKFWQLEAAQTKVQYADSIAFDIDPAISNSSIVYSQSQTLAQADPTKTNITLSRSSFAIPAGTQIVDVIHKVLIQSSYLQDQLGVDTQATASQVQASLATILNTHKTTVQVTYNGTDASGTATAGAFDNIRNTYPLSFVYNLHQYPTYDVPHPAGPQLTDSRPYTVKNYNYLYTGQNTDVLNLKIDFDTTWYSAIMSYTDQFSSQQPSPNSAVDSALSLYNTVILSPQSLAYAGLGGLGSVGVLNPLRLRPIVNDQRDTIGFGTIGVPGSQTSANLMRTLYQPPGGDMLKIDLEIVGDPTLIKQDDWLYTPSPTKSAIYNSWDTQSQSDFAAKFGHIRMDTGQLICKILINTPLDIDTDWTDQGLVFPQPGTVKSLFSGLYRINKIKNVFQKGEFRQTLECSRLTNSDLITNSASATATNTNRTDATSTSSSNQSSVNNTVQPATTDPSGAVNSQYDATRYGDG